MTVKMAPESSTPRRVLVAVSSSRSSKDALLWTLDKLVQSPKDILMLLHVLKPIEYVATRDGYVDATQMDPAVVQKIGLQARQVGGELLDSFEALCAPKQVEALTKLVEGDRRKMILEELERMGATDLVMGGKARRIMPKLKSTSLADYCLKHAQCAVSVIRKGQVIQSAPAKPALSLAPSGSGFSEGLAPEKEGSFAAPPVTVSAPARPVSDKPSLSESDRARWRSTADVAAAKDLPEVMTKGGGQEHTSPWGAVPSGGGKNGREITPGEVESSSDYMARMIFKARAEELTDALAKLETANDPNVFKGDAAAIEKQAPSDEGTATQPELVSEAEPSAKAECDLKQEDSVPPEGGSEAEGEHVTAATATRTAPSDDGAAKGDVDVAAEESDKSAVADKEVDPNSLSLGEAHVGEMKQPHLQLHTDQADSEASIRAHEDSFGDFKSHSSLDNDILSIIAVSKVEGVEKAGEVNGFIQYKRPTPPEYARGLEVLEVLDRWLVAKQAEQQRLPTASESGRSTFSDGTQSVRSITEEDTTENAAHEVPARSPPEGKPKKGGRFSRLFKGRGKKDKGARAAKAEAPAGAPADAPAGDGDDVTVSVGEGDRSVEDVSDDTQPSVVLPDGGPDQPGLLNRIADIIIAEEAEKVRQNDVSQQGQVPRAQPEGVFGKDGVLRPRLLLPDETMDESGSVCDEMDRGETDNMKRMLEEDESQTPTPKPVTPTPRTAEQKGTNLKPRPGSNPRVAIPEGLPPAGRVKVKVQMLNREARGSSPTAPLRRAMLESEARGELLAGPLRPQTDARGEPPTGPVKVQMLTTEGLRDSPVQSGVSRRVSRALLEGMVPEMPREDLEDGVLRPEGSPPDAPPDIPDTFKQELDKYTLESWLGIGQCVSRFLEDDRSSISSEAYDSSVGGSLDTGTPVSLSWDPEPADVAAAAGGHVADDWGYGSSRLGAQSVGGARGGSPQGAPVAEARKEWVKQVVRQFEDKTGGRKGEEKAARTTEESLKLREGVGAREEASGLREAQGQRSEAGTGREAIPQEAPRTIDDVEVKYDTRRDGEMRSPFSSYWTAEATTSGPDDASTTASAPRFGGFALRPATPPEPAIVPLPAKSPEIALPKKQKDRRTERDAYDPRRWAIPLQKESPAALLRRHPSETELFGEDDQEDFLPPSYQEESAPRDPLSALSISQAITDLAASTFADLITDGRIPTSQVAAWREEIAWLTSPGDQVMEMVASTVETHGGGKKDIITQRLRADVQTSLPALRALDDLLQRIVLRLNAGAAASKRELMGTREQTVQVLKAALMINEEVLQEMPVPSAYWASLPKTIRQVLGGDVFQALTSKSATSAQLLAAVSPKTPQDAARAINNLEAAVQMWRAMMADMAEPLAKKRAGYASRASALVHDLKMTWPGLDASELAEFKITRNTDIGRAILEGYSRALISLCGKTISCLDYLLTMEAPEKPARRSRARQSLDRLPSPSESLTKAGQPLTSKALGRSSSRRSVDVAALPRVTDLPTRDALRQSIDSLPVAEAGPLPQQGRGWKIFSRRKSLSRESS